MVHGSHGVNKTQNKKSPRALIIIEVYAKLAIPYPLQSGSQNLSYLRAALSSQDSDPPDTCDVRDARWSQEAEACSTHIGGLKNALS